MKRSILFLAVLLAACGDSTGPETPGLASSQPRVGASDVSVATIVRLTFPREIRLPADTPNAVWLSAGAARIAARVSHPSGAVLQLTPADILDPATEYTVHIGTGITESKGTVPAATFAFTTGGKA